MFVLGTVDFAYVLAAHEHLHVVVAVDTEHRTVGSLGQIGIVNHRTVAHVHLLKGLNVATLGYAVNAHVYRCRILQRHLRNAY